MEEFSYNYCLNKLNPLHLKKIAEEYDMVLIPFSSNTARKAIGDKITQPDFVDNCLSSLDKIQRKALAFISVYANCATADEINEGIKRMFGNEADYKTIADSLLSTGLIYYINNQDDNRNYYIIPQEANAAIKSFTQTEIESICFEYDNPQVVHPRKSGKSIYLSILSALSACMNRDIRTNMDNSVNRRTLNKIQPFLGIEPDLTSDTVTETYINSMINYLKNTGMIIYTDDDYVLELQVIDGWVNLPKIDKLKSIYSFFTETQPKAFSDFCLFLNMFTENRFYDISCLLKTYSIFFDIDPKSANNFNKKLLYNYPLFILFQLGIIELASNDAHEYCAWKLTDTAICLLQGKPIDNSTDLVENKIIIQPNFDLIVSRNADLSVLWEIYRFADIHQCDQMLRFYLTNESIYRGLSNGITADNIFSALEANIKDTIPQNVIYSLKEWCDGFGSVYFMDVFLLRCKNKIMAEQIKLNPKTKDFIKGDFSETDLIIDKTDFDKIIEILKAQGLMPITTILNGKNGRKENAPRKTDKNPNIRLKIKHGLNINFNTDLLRFLPEIL